MVLFFAVRRHQEAYFQRLSNAMRSPSRVVRHKRCWLPAIVSIPSHVRENMKRITQLKVAEIAQARANYSLPATLRYLFYVVYFLLGYYRFLCYLRMFRHEQPEWIALWSGVMWNQSLAVEAGKMCGARFIYFENGLLPNTTTIDPQGVNFFNSVPRDADFFRAHSADQSPASVELIPRAPKPGKQLDKPVELPTRYLFIPFQVDVDRQVLMFSPWIRHMRYLYKVMLGMLDVLPQDMWLVFKEHPSSAKDYSGLKDQCPERVLFANGNSTQQLIENAAAVVTINSTVGIEALLLGKPVITLGQAFYNIDGLVRHVDSEGQLQQVLEQIDTLSVDAELVQHFIGYLAKEYAVEGSWKSVDQGHLAAAVARIGAILDGSFPLSAKVRT